jgi:hypothetical protein
MFSEQMQWCMPLAGEASCWEHKFRATANADVGWSMLYATARGTEMHQARLMKLGQFPQCAVVAEYGMSTVPMTVWALCPVAGVPTALLSPSDILTEERTRSSSTPGQPQCQVHTWCKVVAAAG